MTAGLIVTRRPCPLCGAYTARPRWREGEFEYVRCVVCSAFFTDVTERCYEELRHNAWDEEAPNADALGFYGDARATAHRAFLERCRPFGARRLLDVGCGMGFFLERATAAGWECWGCEPSKSWALVAERRVAKGRVFHGRLEELPREGAEFDLVTTWDVLEHIFDPLNFLRRIATLLAPGGRVFVRTPNLAYALPVYHTRRRFGCSAELGPLNHVVYFTARTLGRALRTAGFTPERWLTLPPPQVATFGSGPGERYAANRSATVAAKNVWAATADAVVRSTAGRLALGSDLDVISRRPP